jgi:hypothetical protein
MKYPVLLCGDQIQFEREHANTPPEERPDWPLPSFDARNWAKAFMKIKDRGAVVDEEWMVTWFANALMRGYDERSAHENGFAAGIEAFAQWLENMPEHWRTLAADGRRALLPKSHDTRTN